MIKKYGVIRIRRKSGKIMLCWLNFNKKEYFSEDKDYVKRVRNELSGLFGNRNIYKIIKAASSIPAIEK